MIGGFVQAQSSTLSKKEQRALLKEEKKRMAEEEDEMQFMLVEHMLKNAQFVLETDMLIFQNGRNIPVSSTLNFILVDSLEGLIQIGNYSQMGENGVGGYTYRGYIYNYTIEKNEKRKSYSVKYNFKTSHGTYNVSLTTYGGGRSEATVRGNIFGGSLRHSGQLVYLSESRVYKGMSY